MKITVNEGWQLGLPDGKLRYSGETFDAPDELAREWILAGQAVAAEKKAVAESANKAVQESKNKAVTK